MTPEYALIAAVLTLSVLLPACYFDYRDRAVPNIFWWIIGVIGIVFTFLFKTDVSELKIQHVLCVIGMVLILLDMLWFETDDRRMLCLMRIGTALCLIIPCVVEFDEISRNALITGIVFVIIYLLYVAGVMIGGADVKCLVSLSFVFQTCPSLGCMPMINIPSPMEYLFPFAFVVLFYAAVISLVALLPVVVGGLCTKGDPSKTAKLGCYRMSITEARASYVWAREDVVDGTVVSVRCTPDEGVFDRLEAVGAETVSVTPIIPFIISITVGFVFALTVGNVFFLPFS